MLNKISAEYEIEIRGELIPFKIGTRAYQFVEDKTGIKFSEVFSSLGSINVFATLIQGSAKAAGYKVDKETVMDWLDEMGTDVFIAPIVESLFPDPEIMKELEEVLGDKNQDGPGKKK